MSEALRLEGLSRRFPGAERAALASLDLAVASGETLCLVGPSGCGKSTTLRLVAGLDRPDGGRVVLDGRDVTAFAPQERDVAMVFQGFALYPHMTARENLEFPLRMRRVADAERRRRVEEAAALLGIGGLLARLPHELSGGEKQRVAMGRALVRQPKLFLFDEPLSNLDAALRSELRVEIASLLRRLHATALYVTHDQAEAMTLGHRIVVMQRGIVEQLDTPRRIYEQPATRFVAGFFGTPPMCLLEAVRDGAMARAGPIALPAPADGGARLVLGVRPEHVVIGDGPGALSASVIAVEPLGAETNVDIDLGSGVQLRARAAGFEAPAPGSNVSITLPPERVRWFDAETGRALAAGSS